MFLVKSLDLKHRNAALKDGSIRIGTINYYREIEDSSRRDGEEGLGHIVWNGKSLSAEQHNYIFTPFDKMTISEGWTISNNGLPIHGTYPNFNAYAFCYSEVKNVNEIVSASNGKATHHYFIKDLPKFISAISESLMSVASDMIERYSSRTEMDRLISTLEVRDVTYRVNYSNKPKHRTVNESNVDGFNPKALYPQDFFQKNTSYSSEKEVRTVWLFFANDEKGQSQILTLPHHDEKYVDLKLGRLPISKKRYRNRCNIKTSPLKPTNTEQMV